MADTTNLSLFNLKNTLYKSLEQTVNNTNQSTATAIKLFSVKTDSIFNFRIYLTFTLNTDKYLIDALITNSTIEVTNCYFGNTATSNKTISKFDFYTRNETECTNYYLVFYQDNSNKINVIEDVKIKKDINLYNVDAYPDMLTSFVNVSLNKSEDKLISSMTSDIAHLFKGTIGIDKAQLLTAPNTGRFKLGDKEQIVTGVLNNIFILDDEIISTTNFNNHYLYFNFDTIIFTEPPANVNFYKYTVEETTGLTKSSEASINLGSINSTNKLILFEGSNIQIIFDGQELYVYDNVNTDKLAILGEIVNNIFVYQKHLYLFTGTTIDYIYKAKIGNSSELDLINILTSPLNKGETPTELLVSANTINKLLDVASVNNTAYMNNLKRTDVTFDSNEKYLLMQTGKYKTDLFTFSNQFKIDDNSVINLIPAKNDKIGGIKIGYKYNNNTDADTTDENPDTRNYPVKLTIDNKAYVNVPWTDFAQSHPSILGKEITSDLYKIATDNKGHITSAIAITTDDIRKLAKYSVNNTLSLDDNGVFSLNKATTLELGGIKIGYTDNGKNYKVQLDSNNNAYVNVPWTDTKFTLQKASSELGGIKIGYTDNGKNYKVQLDSDGKAYVNVPWTDTKFTLQKASSELGGIKLGFTQNDINKQYPVQLDSDGKAYVNVPWTDTNTDTNTTYSAGTGLSLTNTEFNLKTADTDAIGGIQIGYNNGIPVNNKYPVKLDNNKAYVEVFNANYLIGDKGLNRFLRTNSAGQPCWDHLYANELSISDTDQTTITDYVNEQIPTFSLSNGVLTITTP